MARQANGGKIVSLEKQADIMIADHARKDAVPGSYSWRWIEQSVQKGMLEDLEAHRAGLVAGISRPVGSSQPTRNTRTPFTAADDRALALWVTNAERQGLSTKGNEIYQQLERIVGLPILRKAVLTVRPAESSPYLSVLARPVGQIWPIQAPSGSNLISFSSRPCS